MYLVTCGASWVNGDYSWVEEVSEEQNIISTPFLTDDYTDSTTYRMILKDKFKCDTYTNLAYGGSTNKVQIELLKDLLKKHKNRDDIIVIFGLLPLEEEKQLEEIISLDIEHLFLFNTVCQQSLPNALFGSKDLLSLISKDDTQVNPKDWNNCQNYFRKIYKAFKLGLVNLDNHHMTKKANATIACMIFNEIKSRVI